MKTVVVGSRNPVKVNVATLAFTAMWPQEEWHVHGYDAPSGVSEQPFGIEETRQGAMNRAEAAALSHPEADYTVGLEGGIEIIDEQYFVTAWMCVRRADGELGFGRTSAFALPPSVVEHIRNGMELGHATDVVFSAHNSKQKGGVIDFLTDGLIDRTHFYRDAMVFALIPFLQESLYK